MKPESRKLLDDALYRVLKQDVTLTTEFSLRVVDGHYCPRRDPDNPFHTSYHPLEALETLTKR
jgi:hypothetical protein